MEPSPYSPPPSFVTATPEPGNLVLAGVAGLVAALVGAVLWALLASATHFKIGYAAIGVGYLVGLAMRAAGKGRTPIFGYVGAVLALLGCVVGDLLSDCSMVATHYNKPLTDVLTVLTPQSAFDLLQAGFRVLDVLFYVLAAMAGYRNAFIKN